ncbi:DUF6221 family protein [Streptomyces chartreusis]|uniref:DUF6221 family protein n=1 Tax=Streptomyces chartreusis TaxID=1969 RepID=UPI0036509052
MTARGEDVLAWLESAIAAREEAAQKAAALCGCHPSAPSWSFQDGDGPTDGRILVVNDPHPEAKRKIARRWNGTYDGLFMAQHVVFHDPVSVLRRCAADRKLLELHGGRGHSCPAYDYDGDLDEFARFYNHEVCPVVQHLAESYGFPAGQTSPSKGDQVT